MQTSREQPIFSSDSRLFEKEVCNMWSEEMQDLNKQILASHLTFDRWLFQVQWAIWHFRFLIKAPIESKWFPETFWRCIASDAKSISPEDQIQLFFLSPNLINVKKRNYSMYFSGQTLPAGNDLLKRKRKQQKILTKKSNLNVIDDGCKKTQGRSLITCDLTKEGKSLQKRGFCGKSDY